jgi:outer membrane protein OmpA-like peptidoglycan-associated protein
MVIDAGSRVVAQHDSGRVVHALRLGAVALFLGSCCGPSHSTGGVSDGSGDETECIAGSTLDAPDDPDVEAVPIRPTDEPLAVPDGAWFPAIRHVFFERGSAELDRVALLELIAIAEILRTYPQFELIELQGIAMDGRSDADDLSERRVRAVVGMLRLLGVEWSRLQYRVFGDRCDAQATGPAEARQVRILMVRFDGADVGDDPFGDCGDPRAAAVPVTRVGSPEDAHE